MPVDPVEGKLFAEVHFYDPSDFTIMEKDGDWADKVKWFWGAPNLVEGSDRNSTGWGDEKYVGAQFAKGPESSPLCDVSYVLWCGKVCKLIFRKGRPKPVRRA